jgi:hypothetical protein
VRLSGALWFDSVGRASWFHRRRLGVVNLAGFVAVVVYQSTYSLVLGLACRVEIGFLSYTC